MTLSPAAQESFQYLSLRAPPRVARNMDGEVTWVVECPRQLVGYVIGTDGQTIKHLQVGTSNIVSLVYGETVWMYL